MNRIGICNSANARKTRIANNATVFRGRPPCESIMEGLDILCGMEKFRVLESLEMRDSKGLVNPAKAVVGVPEHESGPCYW